jgi:polysaccharide export outer membrane protein
MKYLRPGALSFAFVSMVWMSFGQQPAPRAKNQASYVLGANDQISVEVVELPEFNAKSYRIDSDGSVSLPLLGRVPAAGLTLSQFETDLQTRLKTQVREPHLVTGVVESRSQPVSVMGEVNTPGTQQLQGTKTLFDVLAMAGGLKQDAGDVIKVTRLADEGRLNLPNATEDPATKRMMAEVNVRDVVDLKDPAVNIIVRPHDEIFVAKAKILYVIGNVKKAGGFTIPQNRSLTALEALSLAEGLAPNASAGNAKVLRRVGADPQRQQLRINLKRVLAGKDEDIQLRPDDILFVPDNTSRRMTTKAAETALSTISGIAIWRGF